MHDIGQAMVEEIRAHPRRAGLAGAAIRAQPPSDVYKEARRKAAGGSRDSPTHVGIDLGRDTRADPAQIDVQEKLAHTRPMNAAFAIVFLAALLACALLLPWWALLPAGALLAWLLPGTFGVVWGLTERKRSSARRSPPAST